MAAVKLWALRAFLLVSAVVALGSCAACAYACWANRPVLGFVGGEAARKFRALFALLGTPGLVAGSILVLFGRRSEQLSTVELHSARTVGWLGIAPMAAFALFLIAYVVVFVLAVLSRGFVE